MKLGFKSLRKIRWWFWARIARLPMPGHWRWRFVKLSGVTICPPPIYDKRFVYIGDNVTFDSAYPQDITIENGVHITVGTVILTHYMQLDHRGWISWTRGKVHICNNAFIGANCVITKPITIGHHSVIGAGSVVTKDIPPCEIWGGVPAKFIKKIEITE